MDKILYCDKCANVTLHTVSGSGKKGVCQDCGNAWEIIATTGVEKTEKKSYKKSGKWNFIGIVALCLLPISICTNIKPLIIMLSFIIALALHMR